MAHPELVSRQALGGYRSSWRTSRETGSLSLGVVANPQAGLEASHPSPQPTIGQASVQQTADRSGEATQPAPPPLPSLSSSTSRLTVSAQGIQQWCPSVYSEPQYWHWYYDPTRHQQYSSLTPLFSPMPGPRLPCVSPSGTAPITDTMSESLFASLRGLQSQFATFQESLGNIKSDVEDTLSQLHALRTAQNKTDKCIAELEGMIGVSSTSTASGGRGRRGRGRGRGGRAGTHAEPPLEGADAGIVPGKTLIQSLASIQSAVEVLLARKSRASQSHLSAIHQEAISPLPLAPSVNPTGQEFSQTSLPHRLPLDPSQQYPTLQLTHSTSAIFSTSQSESSPPLPSIAIPTPEFRTSPPPATPVKEYADACIQARPPSPTSGPLCSLLHSQRHTPGFTPVGWSVDPATLGQSAGSFARPIAHTHFLYDTHLPNAANTATDSEAPGSDGDYLLRSSTPLHTQLPSRTMYAPSLFSYPTEPGADNPTSQQVRSAVLLGVSSSQDTSAVPSVGGTSPATVTPLPSTRVLQSPLLRTPLTTGCVDYSMTGPGFGPPGNSETPLASPLSSPSSTDTMPISVSGGSGSEEHVGCRVRSRLELHPEDVLMTSDGGGDGISLKSGARMASELIPAAQVHRRQSSPVGTDDGRLTSSCPTRPSETFADDHEPRVVGRLTCEHSGTTDPTLVPRTYLPRNLPVIPTPPFLTPEPSVGEDRGSARQGSLEVLSPLTPPLLSPFPAIESQLLKEGSSDVSGQIAAQEVTEELTDCTGGARGASVCGGDATEGVSAGAPVSDARSSPGPQIDQTSTEESISATNLGVPVITVTHTGQLIAMSNEDSFQVPQDSSAEQVSIDLAERHPDANGAGLAYFPMNGHDINLSSPWRRPEPLIPATPSRYATPSDSSGPRPSQEEEEVSSTLMVGGSGMSTPAPDSASFPLMFPQHPSRASSVHPHTSQQRLKLTPTYADNPSADRASSALAPEVFSVDPSILHSPMTILLPHGSEPPSSPPDSGGSLSLLTSLDGTDVDDVDDALHGWDRDWDNDADATRRRKQSHAGAPIDRSRGSMSRGRRSEPHHVPGLARAVATTVRTTSEAAAGRIVGGPGASVGELALLSRREPLKIYLKVPETMQRLKRKRGVFDGGEEAGREEAGQDSGCADSHGECESTGASIPLDDTSQKGQEERVSTGVSASVSPCRIGAVTSGTSIPTPIMPRFAPESFTNSGFMDGAGEHSNVTSHLPVSGKRMKRQSERGKEADEARMTSEHARVRRKKRKRVVDVKSESPVKHHVRNGQIVAMQLEMEPEPEPIPPPEPRSQVQASEPSVPAEQVGQDSRTATQIWHRKGRKKQGMNARLSSPAKPSHPSPRRTCRVKSSPTKAEVSDIVSQAGGMWPKLPSVSSPWDAQSIQCDSCDMWFHYGCVAIKPGDPRLEPAALFICPTCRNQHAIRKTLRNHDDICARPDCPEPQVTSETELFFVEKLVGREKIKGCDYVWLAKWEGFPMTQASWIPKENVLGDETKLFDAFSEDAVGEGADLSQDVVLLQEAVEAGWGAYSQT